MRRSRRDILYPEQGFIHIMWRCHNKEFYLLDPKVKELFLQCLLDSLKTHSKNKEIKIHAFCIMGNHIHMLVSYSGGSDKVSAFMRKCHGIFGAKFNKLNGRSGKVAESRPITQLIENAEHLMRVQMYLDANPVRANAINSHSELKKNPYSTYGFYAHGKKTTHTDMLETPEWYADLGDTDYKRQAQYRNLFMQMLEYYLSTNKNPLTRYFIGSMIWVIAQHELLIHRSKVANTG